MARAPSRRKASRQDLFVKALALRDRKSGATSVLVTSDLHSSGADVGRIADAAEKKYN